MEAPSQDGHWQHQRLFKATAGDVTSVFIDMMSLSLLVFLLFRRVSRIEKLSDLTPARWCILMVYITSFLFIFGSAFTKSGFGLDGNPKACNAASLLCVVLYFTTKVFIYFFLVERVHLVRSSGNRRFKDKIYLFNVFGMLFPYGTAEILAIIYRSGHVRDDGRCILRLEPISDIAVITLDITVNIYLTTFFLIPLVKTYSFRHTSNASNRLRRIAKRNFIACIGTLMPTIINMSVMLGLGSEYGWLCLMTCNLDILGSALVLHWVTTDSTDEDAQAKPPSCVVCNVEGHDESVQKDSNHSSTGQRSKATAEYSRKWFPNAPTELGNTNIDDTTVDITATFTGPDLELGNVRLDPHPTGHIQVKVEQNQDMCEGGRGSNAQGERRSFHGSDEGRISGGASYGGASFGGAPTIERRPSESGSTEHINRIEAT